MTETAERAIGTLILLGKCDGRKTPWHVARPGSDRGICGVKPGSYEIVHGVDERVVQHAGRPVCVNCLDRLTASRGSGIVQFQPTRRRPTVATSTDRKKAPSTPLLDLNAYADQTLERLEQERTTINNRLSGLGTQIKRHTAAGDTDKANAAIARRDDLTASRTILADAIALKKAGKTERPSEAAMRESTSTKATTRRSSGGTKKTAARKKTTSRKTAAKKTTARKTARATTAKRAAAKKTTTRKTARRK